MKAQEFDEKFDAGQDVTGDLDLAGARRPLRSTRRVNVDFPSWMVESLDCEAERLGVTRQSLIKMWIAERLERSTS
jgi:hypothetical protein